ncbi:MAG TPA: hypothetical protein VFS40_05300 [Gemmatimonadales bacterium]|nr:hypothetical protein [Gemmatimonadales bacterium]
MTTRYNRKPKRKAKAAKQQEIGLGVVLAIGVLALLLVYAITRFFT